DQCCHPSLLCLSGSRCGSRADPSSFVRRATRFARVMTRSLIRNGRSREAPQTTARARPTSDTVRRRPECFSVRRTASTLTPRAVRSEQLLQRFDLIGPLPSEVRTAEMAVRGGLAVDRLQQVEHLDDAV